jgi:hypothetical protein
VRIAWLDAQLASVQSGAAAAAAREWERTLSIVNPVSTEEAFAKFGAYLGIFPPFAIFARILTGNGRGFSSDGVLLLGLLFVLMNVVCWLAGRKCARVLGRMLGDPRAWHWLGYALLSLPVGMLWGIMTGGLGGLVAFGFGAIVGVLCAVPVGLATFPVFAVLHRIQSHGGMIEERDLRTLAVGIPLAAAALIWSV